MEVSLADILSPLLVVVLLWLVFDHCEHGHFPCLTSRDWRAAAAFCRTVAVWP
jgi:hypothetical protein